MQDGLSQNETPSGLKALRTVQLQPSAFLAVRVQSHFESSHGAAKNNTNKNRFSFMTMSAAIALAVVAVSFWKFEALKQNSVPSAAVYALGKPYLIRMDIREISQADVAYAEISLEGDNIQFSSEKFKHIQKDKRIRIAAQSFSQKQYLPVVVEGLQNGKAQVTVSFYNERHELITTRQMDLNFGGGPKT